MLTYISVLLFVFGSAIGSFLNVVILRHREKSVSGRSECPSCGTELRWFELIPVVSFFIQRHRCRTCKAPISWQYPLVEIATGLISMAILYFLIDHYRIGSVEALADPIIWISFAILAVVWSSLVCIFVYDLYHKIIPDSFVSVFIASSLLWAFHYPDREALFSLPQIWDLLIALFLFLFFFSLWYFSRGAWMGLGDAKLAIGMGFLLGFSGGFSAFMLSFWIGAAVALLFLLFKPAVMKLNVDRMPIFLKDMTMKSEIPFAPFLITGTALAFFYGLDAAALVSFFYF